jgi:hypothetical protein
MAQSSEIDAKTFKERIKSTHNVDTERTYVRGQLFKFCVTSWLNHGSRNNSQYSVMVAQQDPIGLNRDLGFAKPSVTIEAKEFHPPVDGGADMRIYSVRVVGDKVGVLAASAWHASGVMDDEPVPADAWRVDEVGRDAEEIIDRVYEIASLMER